MKQGLSLKFSVDGQIGFKDDNIKLWVRAPYPRKVLFSAQK